MVAKSLFGGASGAMATVFLFLLMQALISSEQSPFDEPFKGKIVDFVRVQEELTVRKKPRRPEPPPEVDEPPPELPKLEFDFTNGDIGFEISPMTDDYSPLIDGDGAGLGTDGEYLPIVLVRPRYPSRAISRGIEGHVLLEFTVTKTGAVRNPVVIESSPPGIFDRSAKEAALKFKYKPKILNGEPIDVSGVLNRIVFTLSDS